MASTSQSENGRGLLTPMHWNVVSDAIMPRFSSARSDANAGAAFADPHYAAPTPPGRSPWSPVADAGPAAAAIFPPRPRASDHSAV
jgi:hypothetical protein